MSAFAFAFEKVEPIRSVNILSVSTSMLVRHSGVGAFMNSTRCIGASPFGNCRSWCATAACSGVDGFFRWAAGGAKLHVSTFMGRALEMSVSTVCTELGWWPERPSLLDCSELSLSCFSDPEPEHSASCPLPPELLQPPRPLLLPPEPYPLSPTRVDGRDPLVVLPLWLAKAEEVGLGTIWGCVGSSPSSPGVSCRYIDLISLFQKVNLITCIFSSL